MAFDGERIAAEGWAIPDVGDGIETLLAHAGLRDVDAVARNQFLISIQVDGGNRVFGAVTTSPTGCGLNGERPSQQGSRPVNIARLNQLADSRARNRFSAQAHLGVFDYLETTLRAQFGEQSDVSRGLMTEAKVITFMDLKGTQPVAKDQFYKLARAHQREIAGEGN